MSKIVLESDTGAKFGINPESGLSADKEIIPAGIDYVNNKPSGFKNYIINGGFDVWQRGTSFVLAGSSTSYTADRMLTQNATDGQFTVSKSSFLNKNSIKFNVDTAPSDLTSTKYLHGLVYRFEGQHLYDLAINHKNITLSFWFNSNVIGEYPICMRNMTNGSNVQSYVTTFNYETVNTPQKIEVTIPLNASWYALSNDNNAGFGLIIGFLNQGNYVTSTTDTWINGYYLTTPSAVNWGANQNNFFEIAELQLEEGDVATKFEYVPYDVQLIRCMRYRQIVTKAIGSSVSTTYCRVYSSIYPMRAAPTVSFVSGCYLERYGLSVIDTTGAVISSNYSTPTSMDIGISINNAAMPGSSETILFSKAWVDSEF